MLETKYEFTFPCPCPSELDECTDAAHREIAYMKLARTALELIELERMRRSLRTEIVVREALDGTDERT